MAMTVDQFSKSLVAVGLMTAEELMALWGSIPAEQRPQRSADFAQLLVERGKLTSFQAQELLAGRGARLGLGDYHVLTEIGAGGMGQVYKARHRRMKRIVALKVMSNAAMRDEASVKRFQREVQAAARLEHENIVTAYASGEAGEVKYLVMQFVDGGDLSQLVKRDGPLALERAVDYILQVAAGLAFAHREGVIHRDIKPANLLLDKNGVIKILDMGLARIEGGDDGLTATEQVMGTVDYMSPEQAANTKGADARADIYSLGCTLWYLLTGKKAYESDTMIGRLMAHRDAPLPSLVKARDDVPWPLEQALHKMIAKRPQDRYQTMSEVIAALEPFGSGASSSSVGAPANTRRSAELAAFMQAMGPSAATTSAKSDPALRTTGTSAAPAASVATATSKAEGDTDPRSATIGAKPVTLGPRAATGRVEKRRAMPKPAVVAGVGCVVAVVAVGAWLVTRDRGSEAATGGGTAGPAVAGSPSQGGGASLAAADNALQWDDKTCGIHVPRLKFDGSTPLTIEAWTEPRGSAASLDAKPRRLFYHPLLSVNFTSSGGWMLQTRTEEESVSETDEVAHGMPSGLSHVAAIFIGGKLKLFVDGRLRLIEPSGTMLRSVSGDPFLIGDGPESGAQHYLGTIDEIRISRIARYEGDFTPERRLKSDVDTLALYHCDEGTGYFAADASGNGRDLFLSDSQFGVKAKWVTSPTVRSVPVVAGVRPDELDPVEGEFGGHRYRFVRSKVNWLQAKAEAEAMGGRLASITSQAESDWINGTLMKKLPVHRLAWIGAERLTDAKAWSWAGGEAWGFTNWLGGEGSDGNVAGVTRSDVKGIGWGDWPNRTPRAMSGPILGRTRVTGFIVEWNTPGR